MDPQRDGAALRRRIGVQLQEAALPNRLKVGEALDLFASFYEETLPADALLSDWGIADKRDTVFDDLSGGQKQRLFITLALLNDPELVFLDELTTGLDPAARRATWGAVEAIRERGKTVVLVTHFMDEAEALADRVAIIDNGRIVALGPPQTLIDELDAAKQVRFTHPNGFDPALLRDLPGVTAVKSSGQKVTVHGAGPLLARVAAALADHGLSPADLSGEQADLEDVFLAHTDRQSAVTG
jgi:ABC-2 type transport system ATP-binding protein